MDKITQFLKDRVFEKSTIITGVTLLGGYLGAEFSPADADAIAAAVIVILGAVGFLTKEAK